MGNEWPADALDWWSEVDETARRALRSGALQPIQTHSEWIVEGDVSFLVRVVDSLRRKDAEKPARQAGGGQTASGQAGGGPHNPFDPYDEELFVADLSPTHVCLLNKYNVMDRHVLLITRRFEHQASPLTPSDWDVFWRCVNASGGLGFYNSGREAGASQPHKHMQLVPLPLEASGGTRVPIEPLLQASGGSLPASRFHGTRLPFRHCFVSLETRENSAERDQPYSARLHDIYREMLKALDLTENAEGSLPPYNLLLTRQWMLLVPRRRETFHGISINALGFAGALLVRDSAQVATLRRHGPLDALRQVAGIGG